MRKILTKKFFERPTLTVAKDLLGKFLILGHPMSSGHRMSRAFMITEVEAYDGFKDKASHAHRGKTARNTPMFGEAGRWYVYFTYGMHWMLNIVTGPKDYPAAVLIRGVSGKAEQCFNSQLVLAASKVNILPDLAQRDGASREIRQQANIRVWQNVAPRSLNGPARLTKFLKIDKCFNNKPASRMAGLWIEDRCVKIPVSRIQREPRIGVGYAGNWAKKKYRFLLIQ